MAFGDRQLLTIWTRLSGIQMSHYFSTFQQSPIMDIWLSEEIKILVSGILMVLFSNGLGFSFCPDIWKPTEPETGLDPFFLINSQLFCRSSKVFVSCLIKSDEFCFKKKSSNALQLLVYLLHFWKEFFCSFVRRRCYWAFSFAHICSWYRIM